ncbi:MAG: beta-ketoacyl-[acyl-carrier-protein] synthase family protein [Sulfurovum sp.]|nr:beta-ketoacyl-[acyl-carrier-protein] synthase family protein [Sulfurovum sp.]
MNTKNRVYITATSSVTCAGENNQILFQNILSGKTGIEQDTAYFFNETPAIGKLEAKDTFFDALISQCQNVLENTQIENYKETLLVIGSSVGGMKTTEDVFIDTGDYANIDPDKHHIQVIANCLNEAFDFYEDVSFSTACTSSANAIGYAYEVLSKGLYTNVLVVGADSLSQTTVGGFLSLGVLSSNPCRPFDKNRDGMNVSEAIACLLIETELKEGSVEVCGVGYSSDAYHMTHPKPKGEGAYNAMQKALKEANLATDDIDYINAHGTGTEANDSAEADAIVSLFPDKPFVGSTKSITGHTLGAAGAIEAIICSMVLEKQMMPPNHFLQNQENKALNLTNESRDENIQYVMSNSFAFGGNNCSLIFGSIK